MTAAKLSRTIPVFDFDPFSDHFLMDPYQHHEDLRNAGPMIRLERYGVYGMARYQEVSLALRTWQTYESAAGVGLVNLKKEAAWRPHGKSALIELDPPEHTVNRAVLNKAVSPNALRAIKPTFEKKAEQLADELVEKSTFDAIPDLAERYPLSVLPDAVGMEKGGRENLLPFGSVVFNAFGPKNERYRRAELEARNVVHWPQRQSQRDVLTPDGLGAEVFKAADAANIGEEIASQLVRAFTVAGIDTTVNGLGNAIFAFATFPDQWDLLRANPSLIKHVFDEVIRWESPIQTFFRTTTCDVEIDGYYIPAGEKVLLFLGAANRDPRHWQFPDRIDVTRRALGHVAFGNGIHACVGQMIARMEAELMLGALLKRVRRIELVGSPKRRINNTLRGFDKLPVKLVAA